MPLRPQFHRLTGTIHNTAQICLDSPVSVWDTEAGRSRAAHPHTVIRVVHVPLGHPRRRKLCHAAVVDVTSLVLLFCVFAALREARYFGNSEQSRNHVSKSLLYWIPQSWYNQPCRGLKTPWLFADWAERRKKLCPFLGKDVPNTPCPHANQAEDWGKSRWGRRLMREVHTSASRIANRLT